MSSRSSPRPWAALAAVGFLLVAASWALGETCELKCKRIDMTSRGPEVRFRGSYDQDFFMQVGDIRIGRPGQEGEVEFSDVIEKELPKYNSKHPFRGVAKLGTQQFGFVFDSDVPQAKEEEEQEEEGEEASEESVLSRLSRALAAEESPARPANVPAEAVRYNRLYFDLNHNGDLTDDKVIEAEEPSGVRYPASYARFSFPRVDLTIEADGTKIDYAFTMSIYSNVSTSYAYASASLNAAVYREGEIELEGRTRRIVLADYNSNGRFDDEIKIDENVHYSGGGVYARPGDMVFVDPDAGSRRSSYDVTASVDQHYLSKLVKIDDRFYEIEVTPAGDRLTLEPSPLKLGHVTNPNGSYRAAVYGENGFLEISGDGSRPAALPQGAWKLLNYTISRTKVEEPAEAEKEEEEGGSLLKALSDALDVPKVLPPSRPASSTVRAYGTDEYEPVEVRAGETVEFPFGPPYRPVVNVSYRSGADTVSLGMTLVGSAGETCSSLTVEGSRPPAPEFTISTPEGEEVYSGKFEYG